MNMDMKSQYAKYLINECIENIRNGSDRYVEINFTINCLEVIADRDFTREEWKALFNQINEYIGGKIHE